MSLKRKASTLPTSDAKKPKANGSITSFFGAPQTVSTTSKATGTSTTTNPSSPAPATPVSKFDKEAWVKKLTPEQKELLKLEIDTLHESWLKELKDEIVTDGFLELKRFLKREVEGGKKVFPPAEDVYSWYTFLSSPFTIPLPS
jgi:uracil-DNA glycosylase